MSSQTFFLIFVPILGIALLGVNILFAPHNPYQEKDSAFECGFHSFYQTRQPFNVSFFIFALLFLLFDLEILLVYPYVVSGYVNDGFGLFIMLIFFLVLTLGFVFEIGKGALEIESKQTELLKQKTKNIQGKNTENSISHSKIRSYFATSSFISSKRISNGPLSLSKPIILLNGRSFASTIFTREFSYLPALRMQEDSTDNGNTRTYGDSPIESDVEVSTSDLAERFRARPAQLIEHQNRRMEENAEKSKQFIDELLNDRENERDNLHPSLIHAFDNETDELIEEERKACLRELSIIASNRDDALDLLNHGRADHGSDYESDGSPMPLTEQEQERLDAVYDGLDSHDEDLRTRYLDGVDNIVDRIIFPDRESALSEENYGSLSSLSSDENFFSDNTDSQVDNDSFNDHTDTQGGNYWINDHNESQADNDSPNFNDESQAGDDLINDHSESQGGHDSSNQDSESQIESGPSNYRDNLPLDGNAERGSSKKRKLDELDQDTDNEYNSNDITPPNKKVKTTDSSLESPSLSQNLESKSDSESDSDSDSDKSDNNSSKSEDNNKSEDNKSEDNKSEDNKSEEVDNRSPLDYVLELQQCEPYDFTDDWE